MQNVAFHALRKKLKSTRQERLSFKLIESFRSFGFGYLDFFKFIFSNYFQFLELY